MRHIRVKNRNNPWFDDNIQNLTFSRVYYHQKAICTKDSFLWDRFKTLGNEVTNCIREANSTITTCHFQPKEMWRTVRQFLPNKSSCSSITDIEPNTFNNYFVNIGNNLGSKFDDFTLASLHLYCDVNIDINNSLITGVVQLDLRKGFDTINHEILLFKLEKYGIRNNALLRFKSYLSN